MMNTTRKAALISPSRGAWLSAVTLILNLATNLNAAGPQSHKLSSELRHAVRGSAVDVLVQFGRTPTSGDLSQVVAGGGALKRTFRSLPAVLARVPEQALHGIAANPAVRYISPDRPVTGKMEFSGPAVGANIAFSSGWTGSDIGIAIIDSGIDPEHPDVKGRIAFSENFVATETRADDPYGHGTHVAVIAAGNAAASTGPNAIVTFRGIAPRAKLINLRVLDSNGEGSDSSVIAAIDRAIELKAQYNIRVLNLSLGRTIRESYALDPLCQAIDRAWQAGIVVVVAAGNNGRDDSLGTSGYGTISSPANSPRAITVGAMKDSSTTTRADDVMTSYSSKGPTLLDHIVKPDLVAPGNAIISGVTSGALIRVRQPQNVVPVSYYKTSQTSNMSSVYFRLSGTSMAAPMVAGATALLLQKNPGLTPDQVKARLMKTASKNFPATSTNVDPVTGVSYQVTYDLFTVGAGYLDIPAALSSTDIAVGSALSPRAVYDESTGHTSIVTGPGSVWNDAVIWGTAVVWGTNVIVNSDAVVWGTAVIWGTQTNQGFAVIWGTDTVWGSSEPFPDTVSIHSEK